MDRSVLLLLNAKSRLGGETSPEWIEEKLRAAGYRVHRPPIAAKDDLSRAIREIEADIVLVGGGDGTVHACLGALLERKRRLALLPLGTGNDLARTLGVPLDPAAAIDLLTGEGGAWRRIDLGEVNGRPFVNVANIGLAVAVAHEMDRDLKRRIGILSYPVAAWRALRRRRSFGVRLVADGPEERLRSIQLAVGNGRHYGGGMTVDAEARPDDGRLDVYSLEIDHWWRLIALAPSLRRGTHGAWSDVRTLRTTECTLLTRRPMRVNADGEIVTETPAQFRVVPGAVRVFAPPEP